MSFITVWEEYEGSKYTVGLSQDFDCESPREQDNVWELWGPAPYGDRQPDGHTIYIDDALNLFTAMLHEYASDAYYTLDEGDIDVTYAYTVKALKAVGYKMLLLKQFGEEFTVTTLQEHTEMIAIAKIDDQEATTKNLEVELDIYKHYCAGECYCVALLDRDENWIGSLGGIFGYDEDEFFRIADELISEIEGL